MWKVLASRKVTVPETTVICHCMLPIDQGNDNRKLLLYTGPLTVGHDPRLARSIHTLMVMTEYMEITGPVILMPAVGGRL